MSFKQPRVDEFKKFINLLMSNAPEGYEPFLLRLNPQGKDPIDNVSWKNPNSRPTISQAIDYMRHGGNIGIAGMPKDNLVNVDCDGLGIKDDEIKPTLIIRSRSRVGRHGMYWNFENSKIPNIATEDQGEVRSRGEYVVCAGSYVAPDEDKLYLIPENDLVNAGYYTVDNAIAPNTLTFEELPKIFKETWVKLHSGRKPSDKKKCSAFKMPEKHSALYDVTVEDIYKKIKKTNILPFETKRWASLFHDSKTDANMSMSNDGLLHCWRHICSLNALQALTVLSGYMTCSQAGTPHNDDTGESLESAVVGDNRAIFEAWKYAKKEGYIPIDDPIPIRALNYIAAKHLHFYAKEGERLPCNIYLNAIKIVEESY